MQVHGPSSILRDDSRIYAELNGPGKFVAMHVGDVRFYIDTTEECDWLIKAAVEAKRLLSPVIITDSERDCDEVNPEGHWPCHRGGDHGVHRDANGDEWRSDVPVSVTA